MKFKVGDKVKHDDGWIGVVKKYKHKRDIDVEMIDGFAHMEAGFVYNAWAKYLTLIPEYKTGDKVLVQDNDDEDWFERVFVCEYNRKYWCISGENGRFSEWSTINELNAWEYIKPLEEKLDIALTCTVNGEEVPLSDISEETLLAIRNKSK